MEESKCGKPDCPVCAERKRKEADYEEMTMAILLALMPLMTMTLFGQLGLF
jgi:hypothetical protein